jgi:hypothetical protein
MRTRLRITAAATAVALLTAMGGAAAASTSGASPSASSVAPTKPSPPKPSPSKPSPPKPSPTGKSGSQDALLDKLAASLHVSRARLDDALRDAKQTTARLGVGPLDPAVVAVVAHDLGISTAKARIVLKEVFGNPSGPPDKKTVPPPSKSSPSSGKS